MADVELGTILAVLRIIRGMNQEELARASGLRSGTISDYERGKMVPGVNTIQRILNAMDFPFAALDHARTMINSLRSQNLLSGSAEVFGLLEEPAALRREVEQVSAEAGRVVSRLTRLMFVVMSSPAFGNTGEDLQSGE